MKRALWICQEVLNNRKGFQIGGKSSAPAKTVAFCFAKQGGLDMSMEITNNYSNYVTNNSTRGKTRTEKNEASKAYSNVREYRTYVTEKYDCLKNADYSVAINSSLLSEAMRDEKTAKWLEYNLSIMPQADEKIKSVVEARGAKVISCHTTINGYDSITTELVTRVEADPGTEKARKEIEERIKKNKEEKKIAEEKVEKRRAEKVQEEKRMEEAKTDGISISAIGNSAESVTKSIISAISTSAGAGVSGFDIRA